LPCPSIKKTDWEPGEPIKILFLNIRNFSNRWSRRQGWDIVKRHKNVHFIPTYSSWLNQVECWFSILSRQALRGASFTSPCQLRKAIDDFVAVYNEKAAV
jgi:transposase